MFGFDSTTPKALRSSSVAFFSFNVQRALSGGGAGASSRRLLWAFLATTIVQAGAHGAMATSAGLLGQALLGRQLVARGGLVDSPALFRPWILCSVGLAAALLKAVAGAASTYAQKRSALRDGSAIRGEIAAASLEAGQAAPSAAHAHAALAVRLREVERGVDEGLLSGIRAVASIVPLALALILLSSSLALAALGILTPFALALGWVRRRLRLTHARASRLAERLHANLDELVRHLDLWRTYGAAARVCRALDTSGEQAGLAVARADSARALISGANEVLAAAALLAVVALVERGGLALGQGPLVAFAAVFFLMYRPLRDLGDARIAVERGAQALIELDELRRDLHGDTALHSPVGSPRTRVWPAAVLEVRGLSVVRGLHATPPTSLEAAPGEIVALVGPTGSGKTSLLRAMLGLEPHVAGTVRYGAEDLTFAGVGLEAGHWSCPADQTARAADDLQAGQWPWRWAQPRKPAHLAT